MTALSVISGLLLGLGAFFCMVGGLGLLRFPDVYTRMHAASVTDTLGAGLVLLGLSLLGGGWIVTVKLGMILLFMWITGPAATHALAKAALERGPRPLLTEDPE